jgi:hypothetical protein
VHVGYYIRSLFMYKRFDICSTIGRLLDLHLPIQTVAIYVKHVVTSPITPCTPYHQMKHEKYQIVCVNKVFKRVN